MSHNPGAPLATPVTLKPLVEFVAIWEQYNILGKACMTRHDGDELKMKSPKDRRWVEPQRHDAGPDPSDGDWESVNLELESLDLERHVVDVDILEGDATDTDDPDCDNDRHVHVAGRIVHDERGNARWKWRGETDSTGTSSGILKYIDPADLSVEGGEPPQPRSKPAAKSGTKPAGAPDAGGGYDPYNQGRASLPGKTGRSKR